MSGHTQGPWEARDDGTIVGTRVLGGRAVIGGADWNEPNGSRAANARLMAAAPELLEALKVASAVLQTLPPAYECIAKYMAATIAKAEGQQ